REVLKRQYLVELENWASSFPEWREAIMNAAPAAERVYDQLAFEFRYFILGGRDSVGGSDADGIERSLIDELLDEIREEADAFWNDCIKSKKEIPRRSANRLHALVSKMEGFAFIDPVIQPMVTMLGE